MYKEGYKGKVNELQITIAPVKENYLTIGDTKFRYDPDEIIINDELILDLIPYLKDEQEEFYMYIDESVGFVVY